MTGVLVPAVCVLDLETTGTDPNEARIVTAYAGYLSSEGQVLDGVDLMVRPDGFEIPAEAAAIHGITTEQALAEGITLGQALARLAGFFASYPGVPIAGANISYDLTIMERETRRVWGEQAATSPRGSFTSWLDDQVILDSFVLDKGIDKYRKGSRKLIATAAHYGVHLTEEEAHGARADAIASGRVVQKLLARPGINGRPLREIHQKQVDWKIEQSASFQDWLRTKADPPQPDVVIDGRWPLIPHQNGVAA